MCHYIDEFKKLLQEVGITGLLYIAMQAEALGFPMSTIRRGRCLMCGCRMSHAEMEPHGYTPRSMCLECYSEVISVRTNHCIISGDPLTSQQVYNQTQNSREMRDRISEEYWPVFVLGSAVVLGRCKPFHAIALESGYANQLPNTRRRINDEQPQKALPVPRGNQVFSQSPRQIEYQPVESFSSVFKNSRRPEGIFANFRTRKLWD